MADGGFTKVPDDLIDAFSRAPLNGAQWRIVWAIIRQTFGYHRPTHTLSVRLVCEATGLNRSTVADELRALVRRGYLVARGDNSHAKEYGVQCDRGRWDAPGEGVRQSAHPTPIDAPPKGTPIGDKGCVDRHTKGTPIDAPIYKEVKENTKDNSTEITEPDGSAAAAAAGSLRDHYAGRYRAAIAIKGNYIGVLGELFGILFPNAPPDHRRLGAMHKSLRSGGAMIDLMLDAAARSITDDPHDYLDKMARRKAREESGDGDEGRTATPGQRGGRAAGGVGGGRSAAGDRHRTYSDGDHWPERRRQ